VIQGGRDDLAPVARTFQQLLAANGYHSTLVEIPSADHPGVMFEAKTLDAVMALTKP
jgi:hypothetical protein